MQRLKAWFPVSSQPTKIIQQSVFRSHSTKFKSLEKFALYGIYIIQMYNYIILQWFAGEWLVPLTESVQQQTTEKQLQGAVCIAWCLFRLNIPLENTDVKAAIPILLKLLSPPAENKQLQWDEYKLLCSFIPSKEQKSVLLH